MAYTLIITEKPSAAHKIADALADAKPEKKSENGVPYFHVLHQKKEVVIVPAVGHLFGLDEEKKSKGFAYPVFDVHWVPVADIRKDAAYTRKYLMLIKKLSRKADVLCVSTDYDIEGETLGYNIVRFACKKADAKRMKFSTLTKKELVESFHHALPTLDWGQAHAGVTRHTLDWFYGINVSRALTSAITKQGMFKILSSGRVQGPTLKILADREKEIKVFVPEPFWQIQLMGQTIPEGKGLEAWHVKDKFWQEDDAAAVMARLKGVQEAAVQRVTEVQTKQRPPTPFDLTTLQTEAYRCLNISPKNTLGIAQNLYLRGLISYPRTASQQLPEALGFKGIMAKLAKQKAYGLLIREFLSGLLRPNNGKKVDPAHPAIYPTGVIPKSLEGKDGQVYDLIVRRFLATFGQPAVRQTMTVTLNARDELFIAKGTRTVEPGWHRLYGPFVHLEEQELPAVQQGGRVGVKKVVLHDKETQPPKRFTESSIIKELERRGLGTKSTRAQILDTLVHRNYVTGRPLQVTELGMRVIAVLEAFCSKMVDEALTRHFEQDMEKIRQMREKPESILEEAKGILTQILMEFRRHEKEIGGQLVETFSKTREALSTVGACPSCKGTLSLRKGRFGRFIACSAYPDCKTTFSLPASGLAKPTDKVCSRCTHPLIMMIRKAKKPQEVCINPDCPAKVLEHEDKAGSSCPKCKEGSLVLRKSVYGHFLACNRFPKCRFIQGRRRKASGEQSKE